MESDISISGNGHIGGKGYTVQLKGNSHKESTIKVMDADATIIKRKFESGLENYIISWSTDNTYYEIETDLSYSTILTILDKLKYFE